MPTLSQILDEWYAGGRIVIDQVVTFPENFIFPKGGISFGNGSVVTFAGGEIINETGNAIIVQGDDITLKADPEQIFQGDFDFRRQGKSVPNPDYETDHTQPQEIWVISDKPALWKMERAYPQWFGAVDCSADVSEALADLTGGNIEGGKATLYSIPDSSEAINAAIKLKRRGEVVIPGGYYKLSRHVSVPPGIRLRGEGSIDDRNKGTGTVLFPWRSAGHSGNDHSCYRNLNNNSQVENCELPDFPLPPKDVDWLNIGQDEDQPLISSPGYNLRLGFLMTVCVKEECKLNYKKIRSENGTDIYSAYPSSIDYESDTGNRLVGTEISSLSMVDLMSLGYGISGQNGYATMRAILIGGAVAIRDVRVYGLSQFVSSTNSEYEDQHRIEHCSFVCPLMSQNNIHRSTFYPEKVYAFDLSGFGDALVFNGNHVASFSRDVGALHLHNCNGGAVAGNILNSDSLIEMCRGISFDSNHIEYGANLTIRSSAVAVRKNFIWRGTRPAIYAYRYRVDWALHFHSQLELSGNVFFITWPPSEESHDASYPDIYDIATDCYGSIAIDNCFRSSNKHLNGEGSYTGIRIGTFQLQNENNDVQILPPAGDNGLTAFTDFNNLSHIASIRSNINGKRVTPMTFTMRRSDFPENVMKILPFTHDGSASQWLDPGYRTGVTYGYKAWIFADFRRAIALRGPIESYSDVNPMTNNGTCCFRLMIGKGEWTNYDLLAGPFVIYIERYRYPADTTNIEQTKHVVIPVCAATQLYDDGMFLSGYPWLSPSDPNQPALSIAGYLNDLAALPIESVKFVGDNVECHCCSAVNLTQGTWTDGDVQYYPDGNDIRKRMYRDGAWHNMK